MKVFCLLLAATLLAGVSSVVVDNCSWGPSYWCLSLENANKCQQVKYCKDKVWTDKIDSAILVHGAPVGNQKKLIDLYKTTVSSPKNVIECEACKIVVGYVDQQLEKNATEQEAKDAVEKLCDLTGSLSSECKSLIDGYFDQIWQLLVNNANADTVCSTLSLCSSKKVLAATAATASSSPKNDVECDACKLVVGYLDQLLKKNTTEAEAKTEIEKLCDFAGTYSSECKSLIDGYFDEIWQLLVNQADPDTVCSTLSLCSSKKVFLFSDSGCEVCKILVGFLDQLLAKNTTEADAKEAVEKFCDILGSLGSECKTLVDSNFDQIWALLEKEADPDNVCSIINLCSSKSQKAVPLTAALEATPTLPLSIKCDVCEVIAKQVIDVLKKQSTKDDAKAAMLKMCDDILKPITTECDSFVNSHFEQIWDAITKKTSSPAVFCDQFMSGCTASSSRSRRGIISKLKCDTCKEAVGLLLKKFADPTVITDKLTAAVDPYCDRLPSAEEKQQCKSLINATVSVIVADALKSSALSPESLCQGINYCPSSEVADTKTKRSVDLKEDKCEICEKVVEVVENSATEEIAKEALSTLCKALGPADIICTFIVDKYFDEIWNYVENKLGNATVICRKLDLCSSVKQQLMALSMKASPKPAPLKQSACDICKLLSAYLKTVVDSNSTEQEVKQELEQLCSLLPSTISGQCKALVDGYFDDIWDLVKREVDSGEICQMIGLCNTTAAFQKKPAVKNDAVCAICKMITTRIKTAIDKNGTKEEVRADLMKFCDQFEYYHYECVQTVNKDFDIFYDTFKDDVDNGYLCNQVDLCPGPNKTKRSVKKPEDATCDECKLIMQYIDTFLKANGSQAEIKEYLDDFCNLLGQAKAECTQLVDQYLPFVWILLESELKNTTEICQLLDLCPKMRKLVKSPSASKCEICEDVMTGLKDVLPLTSKLTVDGLKDACKLFPSEVASECSDIVVEYGPEIIKLLDDAINPQAICKAITLCS